MLDDRFSVLAKPTGAVCNLECEYCFFLSKDQVLDGADAMDEATMELYLRRYLDEQPDGEVTVAWQGGASPQCAAGGSSPRPSTWPNALPGRGST